MAVLVTGGAGFVGCHVVARLLSEGTQVVVLDNFNDYYAPTRKRENLAPFANHAGFTLIEGDIRQPEDIARAFSAAPIEGIIHLAAMSGVRNSVGQVGIYNATNISGSLNMLEAAHQHNVGQFVMGSTSSVYGETPLLPFSETDSADHPLTMYAASKRSAELLAHTYTHLYGLNVNVLRFFNVYGPSGRPDMMPMRLLEASLDGTVIPLFNGGDIARDWTFVSDTVDGIVRALRTPLGYEVMNIGVGSPIAMRDFVHHIEHVTGRTIHTRTVETPLSDPPITFCNNQKARELLGFAPQVTLGDGLAQTWDWFRTTFPHKVG